MGAQETAQRHQPHAGRHHLQEQQNRRLAVFRPTHHLFQHPHSTADWGGEMQAFRIARRWIRVEERWTMHREKRSPQWKPFLWRVAASKTSAGLLARRNYCWLKSALRWLLCERG